MHVASHKVYLGFELVRLIASHRKLHQPRFRLRLNRCFRNIKHFFSVCTESERPKSRAQLSTLSNHIMSVISIFMSSESNPIQSNGTDEHRPRCIMVHTSLAIDWKVKSNAYIFSPVFFSSLIFFSHCHSLTVHMSIDHTMPTNTLIFDAFFISFATVVFFFCSYSIDHLLSDGIIAENQFKRFFSLHGYVSFVACVASLLSLSINLLV